MTGTVEGQKDTGREDQRRGGREAPLSGPGAGAPAPPGGLRKGGGPPPAGRAFAKNGGKCAGRRPPPAAGRAGDPAMDELTVLPVADPLAELPPAGATPGRLSP